VTTAREEVLARIRGALAKPTKTKRTASASDASDASDTSDASGSALGNSVLNATASVPGRNHEPSPRWASTCSAALAAFAAFVALAWAATRATRRAACLAR
jgi:hypothetical protein